MDTLLKKNSLNRYNDLIFPNEVSEIFMLLAADEWRSMVAVWNKYKRLMRLHAPLCWSGMTLQLTVAVGAHEGHWFDSGRSIGLFLIYHIFLVNLLCHTANNEPTEVVAQRVSWRCEADWAWVLGDVYASLGVAVCYRLRFWAGNVNSRQCQRSPRHHGSCQSRSRTSSVMSVVLKRTSIDTPDSPCGFENVPRQVFSSSNYGWPN